ncbi:hypothetical protein MNB_SUP05-5-806 [hydrothermal vent metagenome]|uniref:Uncharacterized protein n=1 Tax=hydrothermal vent metagenome TaxID=652676 RepID=A0A1W1C2Q8_9ZZZZ
MKLGGIGYALIIPILISLTIIAFTYFKTKQVKLNKPYFVYLHWQQSVNWYRPILIVYGISILIFLLGIFISNNSQENMQAIVSKVFILLSLIPLFFTVLTAFVVESGYLFSAGRGEVLQKMIDKYPNHQANS